MSFKRFARRLAAATKPAVDAAAGRLAVGLLAVIRRFKRERISDILGAGMRRIGPWLPEHRIGRANLAAAFPQMPPEEIERILAGVWDNLGRLAAEFAFLDRLRIPEVPDQPAAVADITYDRATYDRFLRLRSERKPALVFAAHLANWELPALVAGVHGLDAVVLYRRPNLGAVADAVMQIRQTSMVQMVPTSLSAPLKLARALEAGRLAAMLVDQHYVKGVEVTFFGRRCLANPLIAALARQIECPIYGTRVVRLPGHRFRAEISEAIPPVRDAEGRIDVQGTMQAITSVIEGWVREHPEQWLWLHRRWR
ncbi:MAG TPA: lipid A biosynthesis lauroyl acyltransferase [Xanthobacteraceae bacterium]|nr:lipid A biosynthesis lauroyl acyltransferase [Xanthobacteraceae bacterium]